MIDNWNFRPDLGVPDVDLEGFDVEAADGHVGSVEEFSTLEGDAHLVVDTGFWIFGKKRVVPARAVKAIDLDEEKIFVSMTKAEIEGAPDHHDDWLLPEHREPFVGYYGPFAW